MTDVNWIYDGDRFAVYTNIESSYYTPEANRMAGVNYISIKTIMRILTK